MKKKCKCVVWIWFVCLLGFSNTISANAEISPELTEKIRLLVESNPGQMNTHEYTAILQTILSIPSARVLVFGVGRDSTLYDEVVPSNGRLVFLEDKLKWIRLTLQYNPNLEVYQVNYNTSYHQWEELLKPSNRHLLELNIPQFIRKMHWDVIIVDGPVGYVSPGRIKSIYTASELAKNSPLTHVFVHDSHRKIEKAYCQKFFRDECFLRKICQLSHYKITK